MQVGSLINKALQGVSKLAEQVTESPDVDFETYLKGMLTPDAANNVSEEELFSALISERLKNSKTQELSDKFSGLFESKKSEMQAADGYIPYEDAAKEALKQLRADGDLTVEEADKIYSEAFAGAQLDDNKNVLFDNRGGAGDDTIAVSILEQALLSARTITEKFDNGEETAELRSLDEASNSKTVVIAAPPPVETDSGTGSEDSFEDNFETTHASEPNLGENIPSLELALNFSRKILNRDLDKSLLDTLGKDKNKEL